MTAACVVQARMGSQRFPGKVLEDLRGRPLLVFMLERLSQLAVDHLVVATTQAEEDDPVARAAESAGAKVVRGSENDVLGRFASATEVYPADVTIRLTADCPLADPEVIQAGLALMEKYKPDYVSNTLVRTFPDGLDVEILRTETLRLSAAEATDPIEREHVTPFIYRRPERFRLLNLRINEPLGSERWTVDTPDDLNFMRSVLERTPLISSPGYKEFLALAGRLAHRAEGTPYLRPAMPADQSLLLKWRNDPSAVANSLNGRQVSRREHVVWFSEILENPASRLWIAQLDDVSIGQVRVDVESGRGNVSLSVDPEYRGRGFGLVLLRLLQDALSADYQVHTLVAEVRKENQASLQSFIRAGFESEFAGDSLVRCKLIR